MMSNKRFLLIIFFHKKLETLNNETIKVEKYRSYPSIEQIICNQKKTVYKDYKKGTFNTNKIMEYEFFLKKMKYNFEKGKYNNSLLLGLSILFNFLNCKKKFIDNFLSNINNKNNLNEKDTNSLRKQYLFLSKEFYLLNKKVQKIFFSIKENNFFFKKIDIKNKIIEILSINFVKKFLKF